MEFARIRQRSTILNHLMWNRGRVDFLLFSNSCFFLFLLFNFFRCRLPTTKLQIGSKWMERSGASYLCHGVEVKPVAIALFQKWNNSIYYQINMSIINNNNSIFDDNSFRSWHALHADWRVIAIHEVLKRIWRPILVWINFGNGTKRDCTSCCCNQMSTTHVHGVGLCDTCKQLKHSQTQFTSVACLKRTEWQII